MMHICNDRGSRRQGGKVDYIHRKQKVDVTVEQAQATSYIRINAKRVEWEGRGGGLYGQ